MSALRRIGPKPKDVRYRLLASVLVNDETGCWEWQAAKAHGYGSIGIGSSYDGTRRIARAHRVAYEEYRGLIPEGLQLDHLCRNKGCVNPFHLEIVTARENTLRGDGPTARNARRTHCPHGHELAGSNIIWRGPDRRYRRCRACEERRWRSRTSEDSSPDKESEVSAR